MCTASNLAVWVNLVLADGAAGTGYYPLEFTNLSGHACGIGGYPGVSATGANGKQLGDAAGRNPVYPVRSVTIPAGGTAHALFSWGSAEVTTSGCKPTTAHELKVYPPNSRTAISTFFDLPSCTVGGSPVRSSAARRARAYRSASGDGFSPSRSSRARMKWSIPFFGHAGSETAGGAGRTGFT